MKKILVIDDEATIRLVFSHILSNEITAVITCKNSKEAREALSRHAFDLVISDIRLGGTRSIEGLELLSHIKNMSPGTKVIIMTGYCSEEMKEDAYRRGAFHYYEKPIDMNHLVSKVEAIGIDISSTESGLHREYLNS